MGRARVIISGVYLTGLGLLLCMAWIHRELKEGWPAPGFSLTLLLGFVPSLLAGTVVGVALAVRDLSGNPGARTTGNFMVTAAGVIALPAITWCGWYLVVCR